MTEAKRYRASHTAGRGIHVWDRHEKRIVTQEVTIRQAHKEAARLNALEADPNWSATTEEPLEGNVAWAAFMKSGGSVL